MDASPVFPTRTFVVRTNCEFSIEIEAESAEKAVEKAGHIDFEKHWTQAWAPMEAEEA
jgi:hypothetical protein